jgi:hypothetical protein
VTFPQEVDLTVGAADLAAYLATSGWELEQMYGEGAEVWRLGSTETRVLLPRDPAYLDYRARLSDAVHVLGALHEWTPQQLAVSVLQTRADVLYVRAEQTDVDGSIPLKQADALVGGSLHMLEAAALATLQPRAVFPSRRPRAVTDFVNDHLRMGHTQRGSFVITILTRLGEETRAEIPQAAGPLREAPHEVGDAKRESDPEPADEQFVRIPAFERRVMTTLATGLEAAARASADPKMTALAAGVDSGASSNLYAALDEMTSYEGLSALDLSFAWAPAVPQTSEVESTIVFTREEVPRFSAARDRLRERPAIVRDSVTGQVVRLERGTEDEEGVITITGVVGEGKTRNVRLNLRGKDYRQAVRAHERRSPVTCSGLIERMGTTYWMRNPVFTVIPR